MLKFTFSNKIPYSDCIHTFVEQSSKPIIMLIHCLPPRLFQMPTFAPKILQLKHLIFEHWDHRSCRIFNWVCYPLRVSHLEMESCYKILRMLIIDVVYE